MKGPRALIAGVLRPLLRAAEGERRPGPYYLPVTGGWLSAAAGQNLNWWQLGYDVSGRTPSAMVEACVSAYSQTVAMCPGDHWRASSKGGRTRVTTSALARILRAPNAYQSISDFLLNLTRSLYLDGNAYALALRNDRYEVDELHLMNPALSAPQLATTGDVFYRLGGNQVIERQLGGSIVAPARDVLHIRLHQSSRAPWPLLGESPLSAAMADVIATGAATLQQSQFFNNQARPSAVLSTDLVLDKDQLQALRDRWDEQTRGLATGGTPILTAGLKVQPWAMSAKDAELAEFMKISEQHIALVYRIPLAVLGLGGAPLGSTEALMQSWIASGLGFALNHIEEAIGVFFGLQGQPDEYLELNTAALLRSALKDRIEALARGVQGGIYAPNEARNSESLDSVPFGDEPRVQQQVVPLSAAGDIPEPAPGPPSPPPSPGPPVPSPERKHADDIKREVRRVRERAATIRRRLN
jgi:HK97 family phage portal protein